MTYTYTAVITARTTCVVYFMFTLGFLPTCAVRPPFFPRVGEPIYKQVNAQSVMSNPAQQSNSEISIQRERYLDIMIVTLTGYVYETRHMRIGDESAEALEKLPFEKNGREQGRDWPAIGFTMIGTIALKSMWLMLEAVIHKNVQGDFLEAGVWRGGASIFAKAVLKSYNEDKIRKVWVCDSFRGLPPNRTLHDAPSWEKLQALRVSKPVVMRNFHTFGLLDSNVKFVEGYFVDSLPAIRNEISKIAVLRMDGDMYESTMDILFNLYEKVSVGGYIIIDDYEILACRKAITEFRQMHEITEEIFPIWKGNTKSFWIKERHQSVNYDWYKKLLTNQLK